MKLPSGELIPCVSKFCLEEWQNIWNSAANNKLHAICPLVGTSCHEKLTSRCEAVIINILKICHTRLTHSYLKSGEDQPTCASCDAPLTVKHILLDCPYLQDIRQKYFPASSLKDIFESYIALILSSCSYFVLTHFYQTHFHFLFNDVNCSVTRV